MTRKFSLTPYLFLTPALLGIAVFVLYPMAAVVYYSFTDYNIITPADWIGLKNYQHLLRDTVFLKALTNSLIYLLVTPTLIVLSIILAIIVNRPLRGISFFRALYYLPVVSGTIAVGLAWSLVLNTNGLLNALLMTLGLIAEPVQWLADPKLTLMFCMMLTVWTGVGFYMVIFLAGLQNIPEELYDAAMIDGCNNLQKHWHISVPGLRPQITFVGVISSLAALNVFSEPFILFGPNGGILDSGTTVVLYLWRVAFRLNDAGYASAVAMGLLVITLGFSILQIRIIERGTEEN
jgi:putative chitobiose transport system permease protein